MPIWKCNHCGNTLDVPAPPNVCPSCKNTCEFVDVTCYIPECGGPESGNIDSQVYEATKKRTD